MPAQKWLKLHWWGNNKDVRVSESSLRMSEGGTRCRILSEGGTRSRTCSESSDVGEATGILVTKCILIFRCSSRKLKIIFALLQVLKRILASVMTWMENSVSPRWTLFLFFFFKECVKLGWRAVNLCFCFRQIMKPGQLSRSLTGMLHMVTLKWYC